MRAMLFEGRPGELAEHELPAPVAGPGHEIVGIVEALGPGATRFSIGQRVGVPWLGMTCGHCEWCRSGRENLCPQARFTGYQLDGGYAEQTLYDLRADRQVGAAVLRCPHA